MYAFNYSVHEHQFMKLINAVDLKICKDGDLYLPVFQRAHPVMVMPTTIIITKTFQFGSAAQLPETRQ
jgi:hypothetical protein